MNRYYCIKCRRKLEHDSVANWYPHIDTTKHLYANCSAWFCKACNLVYVFLNSSGNKNTILTIVHLTLIHLEDYLESVQSIEVRRNEAK